MEPQFSPSDSLKLIESMITKARTGLSENRFYFLLWGWVAFSAMISQFILKVIFNWPYHYIVWALTIPTAIITMIYAWKHESRGVKTYVGESMSYLWTGIGISFFILTVIITNSKQGWSYAYPYFILFYGLGTFVSGMILRFRPLIIGGIFNWVLALICVFASFDYQLLIAALAILTSYIIPGHLLKYENERGKRD